MFEQKRLCDDGTYTTGAEQLRERDEQVDGEGEEVGHGMNRTMVATACKTALHWRIRSYYDFATYRRDTVVNVQAATIVRWHRLGWRIFWRWKSRAARPPIPQELRSLIRRMAAENPLRGEERIVNELLVKLGIWVSTRTVGKYMPKRPAGQPRGDQRWSTFLKNHAKAILACDFFVAVTATFRTLYVFVVIEHGTRRLAHVNVTANPSADWTLQQAGGRRGGRRASVSYP